MVEKVIKFTLRFKNGEHTVNKDTVGEVFHHNNKAYKIVKIYPDFNKPIGQMYLIDGIYYICINGNANEEENQKKIEYFLNLDNPFKGIFDGISNKDISIVEDNSVLSELQATHELSQHIDKIDEEKGYKQNSCAATEWKMLMFYKLGIMQGERQVRKSRCKI